MENLIKRLENVGTELNRKFGTESYELRCELYDIRVALQKLHKPDVSNNEASVCGLGANPYCKFRNKKLECTSMGDCIHKAN